VSIGLSFQVLHRVVDPRFEPASLLLLADVKKVLAQDDAVADDQFLLDHGNHLHESFVLLVRAEAHNSLDPGPIVP
jgi:hypothetical protein